jgi:poly(A) polymerase
MLRAIRFAARFNFAIDPATQSAMRSLAPGSNPSAANASATNSPACSPKASARQAFELLDETGLLAGLPEVSR